MCRLVEPVTLLDVVGQRYLECVVVRNAMAAPVALFRCVWMVGRRAGCRTVLGNPESTRGSGGVRRTFAAFLFFFLGAYVQNSTAAEDSLGPRLFDDPRVAAWSREYIRGNEQRVLRSVEADVLSGDPHPFAAHIWTRIHDRRGRLKEVWDGLDPKLRGALGILPEVELLADQRRYADLLERFPVSGAGTITDVWALVGLAVAASEMARREDSTEYLLAAAQLYPMNFQIAWMLESRLVSEPMRSAVSPSIRPGGALADTPIGAYLGEFLTTRPWTDLDRLAAIDRWLAMYPSDARALSGRAFALFNNRHDEKAVSAWLKARDIYPFYGTGHPARALLRLTDEQEARALLERFSGRHAVDEAGRGVWVARQLALALREAGNKGRAREVLSDALRRWPQDAGLLAERAELERADNRPDEALVFARRAYGKSSDNAVFLVEALREAGEPNEAFEFFEELDGTTEFRSQRLFAVGSLVAKALDRHDGRIRLMQRAVGEHPDSAWMHGQYAIALLDAGRAGEAWSQLVRTIEINPAYVWAARWVAETATAAFDRMVAVTRVRELTERFPWQKALWDERASLLAGADGSERIALWKAAVEANPGRAWAIGELARELAREERWQEARQAADTLFVGEPSSAADRIDRYAVRALVVAAQSEHEYVADDLQEHALLDLDAFRAAGGSLRTYHTYRGVLLRSLGRMDEAAEDQLALARLYPDDTDTFFQLVSQYGNVLGAGKTIGRAALLAARNPFDGAKLRSAMRVHVLYGGSPIVALRMAQKIRERGLGVSIDSLEAKALGQLGDSLADFESYRRSSRLWNSDRYVGWYDQARKTALFDERRRVQVDYDAELPTVEITLANRQVLRRVDHPVSGRIISLAMGPAFVRAEYDATGSNLVKISASSGSEVRLDYDARNRISRVVSSVGEELEYVYNNDGKPTEVVVTGLGRILVQYGDGGEISEVRSIAEDGREAGPALATRVTRVMNELVGLTRLLEQGSRGVPSLPYRDYRADELRAAYRSARWALSDERAERGFALANHLVENLEIDAEYANEANRVLTDVIETGMASETVRARRVAGQAVVLWYELARATKPHGLPRAEFASWSEWYDWLRGEGRAGGDFGDWSARLSETPLLLHEGDLWLPDTDLQNPGFWRRFGNEGLFPHSRPGVQPKAVLSRRNGDVVVGSPAGLSVMRRGFWEWFGFDDARGRFALSTKVSALTASSDVLALAETDDGVLWIGTANGLYALKGDYGDVVHRWRTEHDGLPSPRIGQLLPYGSDVLVGTPGGLRKASFDGIESIEPFIDDPIRVLATTDRDSDVIVGTDIGVYVQSIGAAVRPRRIARWPVDDVVWAPSLKRVILQRGTEVYSIDWKGDRPVSEPELIPGQANLKHEKELHGLSVVDVPEVGELVMIMTDQGLSFYRDGHFESMPLPLDEQRLGLHVGPHAVAVGEGSIYLTTDEGLYAFESGQVTWHKGYPVHDLVTDPKSGLVYVAHGGFIGVIDDDDPNSTRRVRVAATNLALDGDGSLIANDRHTVVRLDGDHASVQELFDATPITSDGYGDGPIRSLLVASDGTIWVAAGGSVFRWEHDDVEEFSFFLDPGRFPSRTHMISRVVETIDGHIWVVASDEGHLSHLGVGLQGGILQWDGSGFKRVPRPNGYAMITGYTRLDHLTAIVGSTAGFFRHTLDGEYRSFSGMSDASYQALRKRSSMLWLGRDGAQLATGTWLFPSAGGVLLYHRGVWHYPGRLNQMLPDDQRLGQYGGRTVHAVGIDTHGRVYAGTDLGLLVYDAGGSARSLLIDSDLSIEAFGDAEVDRMQELGAIVFDELDPDSEPGRLVQEFRAVEQEIRDLESNDGDPGLSDTVAGRERLIPDRPSLKDRLAERERARQRLLHQLENEHFGLFQMLRLDPRELATLHEELQVGQAVVQYLPTPKTLYIQLVTQQGVQLREVDVGEKELFRRAKQAAARLASRARRIGANGAPGETSEPLREGPDLPTELAWLYDQLLRPVEHELSRLKSVFVVPVGTLSYLPFGALIYSQEKNPVYAAEQFAIGVLPSLFHLQLVLKHRASYLDESLLIGDPDDSLPSARSEVLEIHAQLPHAWPPLLGADATFENFVDHAERSRIIHLATHGVLNYEQPGDSFLLMADGYRLSVVDISLLKLDETDLVVLSACDSGIGRDGLEYATLARAFAHARVPSVVASMWQVDDQATRQLMSEFYSNLVKGEDVFVALALAQRAMIRGEKTWRDPAAWSGFQAFGRP